MKREQKPFVVEVKRGKRRPSFGSEIEHRIAKSSETNRRAEIALFAASPVDQTKSAPQNSEPTGRILPSLIEAAPALDSVLEEFQPRRRGRKPGSKNKPKISIGGKLPVVGALAPTEKKHGFLPVSSDRPGRDRTSSSVEPTASSDPGSTVPPTPRVRLRERSAILARYVFGSEPGPGERGKRASRRKTARTSRYNVAV